MERSQNNILPFWEVIPPFFLLPLKGVGIIALLIFTSLFSLFSSLFIYIPAAFLVLKYSIEILENTAEGRLEAPALSSKVLNQNHEVTFKLLLLYLLPFLVAWQLGGTVPDLVIYAIISFYSLALPASIMTLAYTRSFASAINPVMLFSLVGRLGWSYIILFALLFLLSGAAPTAYFFLTSTMAGSSVFIFVLFQIYFTWVMYAIMGYVLYQNHDDIGYDLPEEELSEEEEQASVLTGFNQLVVDEKYTEAKDILKGIIQQDPENLELRKTFHKIVKMSGDNKQLTIHGKGLIGRLLKVKRSVDAVHVYLDCMKVDQEFNLGNDEYYLPLVNEMRRMKRHKQAITLSNGFHQRYPNSTYIPHLYLLIAKIFIEDLSQDDKARSILSFLKQKYKGHDIEAEVDVYRTLLTRI